MAILDFVHEERKEEEDLSVHYFQLLSKPKGTENNS